MGRLEQAVELEKALTLRMPWLTLTFSGKPTNSKYQTLATISHLTRITREERRSISAFIKNAWKRAEILRSQLNELVSEFVHADTDKRRMNVYTRYTNSASWHHHQAMTYLQKFAHNFLYNFRMKDTAYRRRNTATFCERLECHNSSLREAFERNNSDQCFNDVNERQCPFWEISERSVSRDWKSAEKKRSNFT